MEKEISDMKYVQENLTSLNLHIGEEEGDVKVKVDWVMSEKSDVDMTEELFNTLNSLLLLHVKQLIKDIWDDIDSLSGEMYQRKEPTITITQLKEIEEVT
jgi:hypothetical protein